MPDATGNDLDADILACIELCIDCHKACLQTAMYCLQQGGEHAEPNHVRLMLDCAEICQTSANFMLRGSDLHGRICAACAEVCRRCADDCERMADDDNRMAACAEECWRCADSCERMATYYTGARSQKRARPEARPSRGMTSRSKEDLPWKTRTESKEKKSPSSSRRASSRSS